jgi:hypothetical protein
LDLKALSSNPIRRDQPAQRLVVNRRNGCGSTVAVQRLRFNGCGATVAVQSRGSKFMRRRANLRNKIFTFLRFSVFRGLFLL